MQIVRWQQLEVCLRLSIQQVLDGEPDKGWLPPTEHAEKGGDLLELTGWVLPMKAGDA